MKKVSTIITVFLLSSICAIGQTKDKFYHSNAQSVKLYGFLDDYIQNSITHWSKEKVPYKEFADFFSNGREIFATGEAWGKAIRAACVFYWYTGDKELKAILDSSVKYMLTKERANGSISCNKVEEQPNSKEGDLWERKYVLLGLEQYYLLVNPDRNVLNSLIRQADCLIAQIGDKYKITDLGWSPNNMESSTLLEPIMILYSITKNQKYLKFAEYIISEGGAKGYNLIEEAFNNVPPHKMTDGIYPKAYDMLSYFEGVIEYYRVTGDEKIKRAFVNLFNNVGKNEITIIGNGGSDAPYHDNGECWGNTAYEQTNPNITRMMETCVGVTWLKYCSHINRLTGSPDAIDMIEKYIYNGLIGAQKPNGKNFSYMSLLNGTKADPEGWGLWVNYVKYTCCDLNGPLGLAYIPYIAFMNAEKGPVINLFNAGEFSFKTPAGQNAKLKLISNFPLSGDVKVKIEMNKPEKFEIKIRIPGWSAESNLLVNNITKQVKPATYHTMDLLWSSKDSITLKLDMRCKLIASPKGDNYQAITYGPIVLARDENMDFHFNSPENIIAKNGYVDAIKETPYYNSVRLQFKVPTENGFIRLIDYASCDNWNGRKTYTWIPQK